MISECTPCIIKNPPTSLKTSKSKKPKGRPAEIGIRTAEEHPEDEIPLKISPRAITKPAQANAIQQQFLPKDEEIIHPPTESEIDYSGRRQNRLANNHVDIIGPAAALLVVAAVAFVRMRFIWGSKKNAVSKIPVALNPPHEHAGILIGTEI
jgi:hypothetical protein